MGRGRIERALVAIFDGERDNAFTIDDLCERIWPDLYPDRQGGQIERKHRTTVSRAARNIARQRPEIQWLHGERVGGALVFFRHDEVMSYAMARLKADRFRRYRSKDPRLHWSKDEGALRRELDDESRRKLIRQGGECSGRSKSFSHDESRNDSRLVMKGGSSVDVEVGINAVLAYIGLKQFRERGNVRGCDRSNRVVNLVCHRWRGQCEGEGDCCCPDHWSSSGLVKEYTTHDLSKRAPISPATPIEFHDVNESCVGCEFRCVQHGAELRQREDDFPRPSRDLGRRKDWRQAFRAAA
jgi:hypothetical protein